MKRILKYPGSKWKLAKKLVPLFPPHTAYIEPFFGSGAVFFNKNKSNLEIINDINGEVVNMFKVVRDNPNELAMLLQFTPYSREEYYATDEPCGDPIEKARRFIANSNMAIGGTQIHKTGWRHSGFVRAINTVQSVARDWKTLPEGIFEVADRLKDAEIENVDALKLIEKYNYEGALFYVDPPYLLDTRKGRYYHHEMADYEQHEQLLDVCLRSKGFVMISGYDHELYNEKLKEWDRIEFESLAEKGQKRIEVVWCNWDADRQLTLF